MRRFIIRFSALAALVGLSSACTQGSTAAGIPSPLTRPLATTVRPTAPALPSSPPPTTGAPGTSCQGGWVTPATGSELWKTPLELIHASTGEKERLVVVDMRTFVGPESPPDIKKYLKNIRRWYVKLYAKGDLAFQGRFLVESRAFGSGVVAVAPYDTDGFASPNWVGFQFDSEDHARSTYPGLPGTWRGIAYDFVNGGAGLGMPGLPAEMAGCLAGT